MRTALEALDTLAGVLLSPSSTLARITDRGPLGLALLTAVSVAVISGLVLVPNPPELLEDIMGMEKGTLGLRTVLPLWVALFMAVLWLQAAFVHLEAMALRAWQARRGAAGDPGAGSQAKAGRAPASAGRPGTASAGGPGAASAPGETPGAGPGTFRGIFCGLCFAYLPGWLSAPLIMLRALLASERANAAYQVVFPLACLWVFYLGVTAIRQNYRLPPWRAAALGAVAFLVMVVLPIALGALVMTQVMGRG